MTPDIQLIINCCKTDPKKSDIEHICTHLRSLDNQQLLNLTSLCYAHGVFPLLYLAIQAHASNQLSVEGMTELKQQYLKIVMFNMRMAAELTRIMSLLENNNIRAIAFKGPTLAQLAYDDITLRQYCDLDILIRKKDVYKTASVLTNDHYDPMDSIEFLKNAAKIHVEKNYEFYHRKHSVKVEIHWQLINSQLLPQFNDYNVWLTTQKILIDKTPINTLDTEFLLIYLCNHGAAHQWERLEWILDIDKLIGSQSLSLNWQSILTTSQQLNCNTSLLLGLNLAHILFDTQLPESVSLQLEKHPALAKLNETTLSGLNSNLIFQDHISTAKNLEVFRFHLGLQDTVMSKFNFLLTTIFSYSDRDVMLINLPRHLYFLYYALRIFRLIFKYTIGPLRTFFRQFLN